MMSSSGRAMNSTSSTNRRIRVRASARRYPPVFSMIVNPGACSRCFTSAAQAGANSPVTCSGGIPCDEPVSSLQTQLGEAGQLLSRLVISFPSADAHPTLSNKMTRPIVVEFKLFGRTHVTTIAFPYIDQGRPARLHLGTSCIFSASFSIAADTCLVGHKNRVSFNEQVAACLPLAGRRVVAGPEVPTVPGEVQFNCPSQLFPV